LVLPNIELDVLALNLVILWISYAVPITFGVAFGMLIHDWGVLKAMNKSGAVPHGDSRQGEVTWLKEKRTHARNRAQ
jgi:hypothetical protein